MHAQASIPAPFSPTDLMDSVAYSVNRHLCSFSQWFRLCVAQRSALALVRRTVTLAPPSRKEAPEPGFPVDGVHLQTQEHGSLPDIQEPLTDESIRPHFLCRGHQSSPLGPARFVSEAEPQLITEYPSIAVDWKST